jgi:glycosyltransferase involved in cell wall biosynthesis
MQPGGTERQLLLLMAGLRDEYDITLICTREEGSLFPQARALAQEVHVLESSTGWDFRLTGKLTRLFKSCRPDIVQSYLFGFDYWAARAARKAGVPVVITTRRELAEWQEARHLWLVRKANALADAIVANSHAVARYAAEHEDESESRYRVIYNGLDTGAFATPDAAAARQRFGIPPDLPVVGMAANFTEIKDHGLFVVASGLVSKMVPEAHYFLLGNGPTREYIERGMALRGPERVHIRHTLDEMPLAYAAMDVCVLTSKMEGAPNVLIEAMAAGRPVVAAAVGGIPEIVEDGVTGLLESFRNPALFADKILCLLQDSDLRTRMGSAGRERAQRLFTVERMVAEYKALYLELLTASRPSA